MNPAVMSVFALIFIVIFINIYITFNRANRSSNRRSYRKRVAPDEAKQALWRDKEVARRIEREQDDALDSVKLRNETFSYYEKVRQLHAKKDAIERLGLNPDEDIDNLSSLGLDEYLDDRD